MLVVIGGCCTDKLAREHAKKRHPVRYESGLWNPQERQYDAGKREYRGVLRALKKMRSYLYSVYFTLEIDANTLVH